jgi:hypothetical protein
MRRCSFSSSVLARLRGGRLVLGSGSTWPHDLRFLADLPSGATDDGSDASGEGDCEGVGDMGTVRSSILMVVEMGSTVGGGVSGSEDIIAGVVIVWANIWAVYKESDPIVVVDCTGAASGWERMENWGMIFAAFGEDRWHLCPGSCCRGRPGAIPDAG